MDEAKDKKAFAEAIGAMCLTMQMEASADMIRGYWLALSDLKLEDVQKAVVKAMRTSTSNKKLPFPADLRVLAGAEVSPDQKGLFAWNDVLKALPLGPYKHVDFEDRVINACIRSMGGWPNFLSRFGSSDEEKWVRIEFLKSYKGFVEAGCNGDICRPLAGLGQKEVVNGKLSAPVPRRIGCDEARKIAPSLGRSSSGRLGSNRTQHSIVEASGNSSNAGGIDSTVHGKGIAQRAGLTLRKANQE